MSQNVSEESLKTAYRRVDELRHGSIRTEIPVRARFIRDLDAARGEPANTPLRALVRAADRDGLAIKLYLGLLWRCSAPPFSTEVPARLWGELLALPPETAPRRVSHALKRLEAQNLLTLTPEPGQSNIITLLDEGGRGDAYSRPRGSTKPYNRWIKVPVALWKDPEFHHLTTPGLAMMLAILAEQPAAGEPVWWSMSQWERRIGFSPSTRSRGVAELRRAGLLKVRSQRLASQPKRFTRERVRSTYHLTLPDPTD